MENEIRSTDAKQTGGRVRSLLHALKISVCGFFMALADSVPGVSGGTVAFMTGIYDSFISSFPDLLGREREKRRGAFFFLLKLGVGWLVGMGLSVALLDRVFTTHIYEISSLFFGLVAASVPLVCIEEKETLRGLRPYHLIPFLAGGAAVVALCEFRLPISAETLTFPSGIYLFVGGALAISAMVLPGISGSTLLLAFGLYLPILSGIRKLLAFDFSSFFMLFLFGCGVLLGIFVSFRGIRRLLRDFRTATVSCVVGLMVGSLYAVVKGPTTLDEPLPPVSLSTFYLGYCLLGVGIVASFALGKVFSSKRREGAKD